MARRSPHAFNTITLALVALLAGCASPPEPPQVDDSNKRPVNTSHHVEVQQCRAELSAAKIVLAETLARPQPAPTLAAVPSPTSSPNRVLVITFPTGSSQIAMQPSYERLLVDQVKLAKYIVIRGRTDSLTDSPAETRLAMRRAESAYAYLVRAAQQLPPEGVRITWQGSGDPAAKGTSEADRLANRRVEIEFYRTPPQVEVLSPTANQAS